MRVAPAIMIVLVTGCEPSEGDQCIVTTDCAAGYICVDGTCGDDPAGLRESAVCDGSGTSNVDVFAALDARLDSSTGRLVAFDGATHLLRSHLVTGADAAMKLQVTVSSSDFDPILYVFDDDQGSCLQSDHNDDIAFPDDLNARVVIDCGAVNQATLVVTSADQGTGAYALDTRPLLCGLATDSFATYDRCVDVVTAAGCDGDACVSARDYCCVSEDCRAGHATGDVISIVPDNDPQGACAP